MIPTSVLVELATLGLSKEQAERVSGMLVAVEAATKDASEAAMEKGRDKARARLQRWREKNGNVSKRSETSRNVENDSRAGVARGLDNLLSRDQAGQKDQISFDQEFESDIWPAYPRKVAKGHARKTYIAIRKRGVPFESILSGVKRYAKERASEDPAFTKHASTWLNSEGWLDEPAVMRPRGTSPPQPAARTPADVFSEIASGTWEPPNERTQPLAQARIAGRG